MQLLFELQHFLQAIIDHETFLSAIRGDDLRLSHR